MDTRNVEEEKRRDLAVEKHQAAYEKYQEQNYSIGLQLMTDSRKAKQSFTDTDYALKLHSKVHNQELDLRQPLFSDFYKLHLRSRLRKECLKQAIWQIYLPAPANISRPTFDVQFPNSVHQADLLSS